MLYLIGLGLYDEKDISIRGLEILRECDEIYAEFYTNRWCGNLKNLGLKKARVLIRKDIEENPGENVLKNCKGKKVALLVPGDPMIATTHIDLVLRAEKLGVSVEIVHSSSVCSAISETGLQAYKFGKTASIAFPEKDYFPESFYNVLKENLELGLHTLMLLDVKSEENRFMSVNQAIEILLEIEDKRGDGVFTEKTRCVGCARLGSRRRVIKEGSAHDLLNCDFGLPPHCLVVPGELHFMEEEALVRFRIF